MARLVCFLVSLALGLVAPRRADSVVARRADALVDSVGVNTHFGYTDRPYVLAFDRLKVKLAALGIRHIRDGNTSNKDRPVIGPAMAHAFNAPKAGDLSALIRFGNMHPYPGGWNPSRGLSYLLLWQEVTSYDVPARKELALVARQLTVKLGAPMRRGVVYLPSQTGIRPAHRVESPESLQVAVPDQLLIIELTPREHEALPTF